MGEWHRVMADITLNIGMLEDSVLAILHVCVCAPKCVYVKVYCVHILSVMTRLCMMVTREVYCAPISI